MVCTLYAHYTGFDKIEKTIQEFFPGSKLSVAKDGESNVLECEVRGGLFRPSGKLTISYREKAIPSYKFAENDQSSLTNNLRGLYGYVRSLPFSNESLQEKFLQKILTLNCEFSIAVTKGEIKELKNVIQELAKEFDAVLFVQPKTVISKSKGQHFLDSRLDLIIDQEGNSGIDSLDVKIDASYFDQHTSATEDQLARKSRSEQLIGSWKIKVNSHLPVIDPEETVTIRRPEEIAQRVAVLAVVNLVAFSHIPPEEARDYLQQNNLWDFVSPAEKDFLNEPTDEKKSRESWKCECIYTLLWALNKTETLPSPAQLCDLGNIPPEKYPVGKDKSPEDFIRSATVVRSKTEILDASDLYYRLDWACVDARINGKQITEAHPGVVYERHYALNWLMNYGNQEWDDVSCDT
ncbi:DUF4272 domain-containing protein [Pseudoflavitalea rhizosphaerae]|uniref:DUF4272 domain-containing protein n=1 Tax=Pseudoflavitalea rhizosphaerae TaxID=1884793 RepID=UPI000F8D3BB1|nr:DUF4272 domain-containing protein [Pseudoflavitalea rhizosphaerae]